MNNFEGRRQEFINSTLSALATTGQFCNKYLDENELPEALRQLSESVERCCALDIKFAAYKKALDKTENIFKGANNLEKSSIQNTFKQLLNKEKATVNKNSISKHDYMVQYLQQLEDIELDKEGENLDDIVLSNEFTPPVDPITKAAIRNPVKNSQCGHIYEDESIRALIANKNTRCPYIGCPASQYVQINYLQPCNQLKKKIDLYFLKQ